MAEVYDAEDYKSMWADISQHTVGQSMTQDEDTEFEGISTGIFQNHLRSSQVGTLDLNESFRSASQASLNLQNVNWANDTLSMLDEETQSNKARHSF